MTGSGRQGRRTAASRQRKERTAGSGRWEVEGAASGRSLEAENFPGGEKREKAGRAHGMLGVRKGHWPGFAGNEKAILAKAQW